MLWAVDAVKRQHCLRLPCIRRITCSGKSTGDALWINCTGVSLLGASSTTVWHASHLDRLSACSLLPVRRQVAATKDSVALASWPTKGPRSRARWIRPPPSHVSEKTFYFWRHGYWELETEGPAVPRRVSKNKQFLSLCGRSLQSFQKGVFAFTSSLRSI